MYIFNLYITWFKSIKSGYYQDKEIREIKINIILHHIKKGGFY
jgi:hypothetical protein